MKVLIIGGTGAMGIPLRNMFAEKENEIIVTSRRSIVSDNEHVRYVQGDGHDDAFLLPLIRSEKCDVVIDFMVYKRGELSRRLDSILENTSQYVYLSSCRVFAENKDYIVEDSDRLMDVIEDTRFTNSGEYAITKAEDEDLLHKSGKNNWTIIRPYITYFNNRLQLGVQEKEDWLFRAINKKHVLFSHDIAEKYTTLTSGIDVADCIYRASGNNIAFGQAYNCVSSESLKWEEIVNLYSSILLEEGIDLNIRWTDTYTGNRSSNYQVRYDRLYNRVFDNKKIKEDLGKSQFISTREGLATCIKEFLRNGKEFGYIYWDRQGCFDYLTGDRFTLQAISGVKNKLKYLVGRIGFM